MLMYVFITLNLFNLIALEAGEKLTFNSATNNMGPRKFLHYGNFKKVICVERHDLSCFYNIHV